MRKIYKILMVLCLVLVIVQKPVRANEIIKHKLNEKSAKLIKKGAIRLENNETDSLLIEGAELNPKVDSDHDGILNEDEIYTYEKEGITYYGYYSHPLLLDSDGDGLNDKVDPNPLVWDISPRDMALFMELVYRDDDYIKTVLDDTKELNDIYDNRNEYHLMHSELAPFWEFKESFHKPSGLDAVLFSTKSKLPFLKDNTVNVLAIRGTESGHGSFKDYGADAKIIAGFQIPDQAYDVEKIIQDFKDKGLKNLYLTGHSLGGYLAQMANIYANQNNYSELKKAYTFNAPKIRGNWFSKWISDKGAYGDQLTKQGKSVHYAVENDSTISVVGNFDGAIKVGRTNAGHGSRSFFEKTMNGQPGFTVGDRLNIEGQGRPYPQLKKISFEKSDKKLDDVYQETDFKVVDEVINQYETINLTDNLANKEEIANIKSIEDASEAQIDTSKAGNYDGKIKLIFSDNSEKILPVKIVVKELVAVEIPSDKISKEEIYVNEEINLNDNVKDIEGIKSITSLEHIDNTKPIEKEIDAEVLFNNKAKLIIKIPLLIKERISQPLKKLEASKTYKIEFVSKDHTKLIEEITKLKPELSFNTESKKFEAKNPSQTEIQTDNGIWKFEGYTLKDTTFVGTWFFEKKIETIEEPKNNDQTDKQDETVEVEKNPTNNKIEEVNKEEVPKNVDAKKETENKLEPKKEEISTDKPNTSLPSNSSNAENSKPSVDQDIAKLPNIMANDKKEIGSTNHLNNPKPLVDHLTGVKILNEEYKDDKYRLVVTPIKEEQVNHLIKDHAIQAYDIKVIDKASAIDITSFTNNIEIFIPTNKKALKAVYIKDNKIEEEYKVTKVDNGYTFKTNHLSLYGLVYDNSKPKQTVTHNPNWQQDLRKHNEFISKHNKETNKTLPNTGHINNHSILLASTLLTLVAYKLYKKED